MRSIPLAFGAAATLLCATRPVSQGTRPVAPSQADVAIASGRLEDAEQALFAASDAAPHEPSAARRTGLVSRRTGAAEGRRGAPRGGSPVRRRRIGDRRASCADLCLARATGTRLRRCSTAPAPVRSTTAPDGSRITPPARGGADSVTVALEPNEIAGFGRIALMVGRTSFTADIDPNVDGLVLPSNAGSDRRSAAVRHARQRVGGRGLLHGDRRDAAHERSGPPLSVRAPDRSGSAFSRRSRRRSTRAGNC